MHDMPKTVDQLAVERLPGEGVGPRREGQDVMRDGPALVVAQRVGERGHRCPIEAQCQGAEDVGRSRTGLELATGEIGRPDRKVEVVTQLVCRRSIATSRLTMAFPTLRG